MKLSRYDLVLMDRRLFFRKLVSLLLAVALLVPLIYLRLYLPGLIYLLGLLILHVYFVYVYLSRVPWKELLNHKAVLAGRIAAVLFFGYILTLLQFSGSPKMILTNLSIATTAHVAILLALMVRVTRAA